MKKWINRVLRREIGLAENDLIAIFYLSIGLTKCLSSDCHDRYFDAECFGTKVKAFRNLWAEWEA